jgi:cytochrome c553
MPLMTQIRCELPDINYSLRQMSQKTPKHIVRLLLLLSGALLFAYSAKVFLTDPSFYEYGHYRADAVPELAEGELVYKGSESCRECHSERNSDWSVSSHKAVQCEVCHGTDQECPDTEGKRIPTDTIRLCSTCHEAMPARPASQPQIVVGEHPFADGEIMQCIECHNPHTPGPVLREEDTLAADSQAAEAGPAMPESATKCAKCHGKRGEGIKKNPALAGLEAAVFVERMQLYRSGGGESKIMTRFARALSDEEIAELAAYYASLPAASPE